MLLSWSKAVHVSYDTHTECPICSLVHTHFKGGSNSEIFQVKQNSLTS